MWDYTTLYSTCLNHMVSQNKKFNLSWESVFFTYFWTKLLQIKSIVSLALSSREWMKAALKTCMQWKMHYFYFGILVAIPDAWLRGSGFTACVFSALSTSWPSTEFCPEMSSEFLSGSHGPSTESLTSVVVCKRDCGNCYTGLWRYNTSRDSWISKWLSKYALVKQ